jgi:isoprenylcysteine carboxyl methyltransferase (ICMT) family protein YpbQ
MHILFIFITALGIRLISLFISVRNEKKLKASGAVEYGQTNSLVLTLSHIAYYLLAITECIKTDRIINEYTYAGIILFLFSMVTLFLVIKNLGALWTVKLIIAPNHHVVKTFLFRLVRHPNYFLNVIPELIAIALICQSWRILMVGFPLYLIPLAIRIYQEENIMREEVEGYNI